MLSTFLKELRTLGFEQEATPYTAATLTASNYNGRFTNIEYDEDIQQTARKLARGDLSLDAVVIGKRGIKIKFRAEIYAADGTINATTPPVWMAPLASCGTTIISSGSGSTVLYSVNPSSLSTAIPMTIQIQEVSEGSSASCITVNAHGCVGTASIVVEKVGSFAYVDYEFTGAFDGYSSRARGLKFTPVIADVAAALPVLSASIRLNSIAQTIDKVKLDLGNKIELYTDPSQGTGYFGAHIVSRDPSITLDPDMHTLEEENQWTNLTSTILSQFVMEFGGGQSPADQCVITAPQAQIIPPIKVNEREGHLIRDLKLRLVRGYGDDEWTIISRAT